MSRPHSRAPQRRELDVAAGEIRAAGFGWRHAGRDRAVLHDVTFHIPAGQRLLLAGPSGGGKSTLLSAIAGVLGGDDEGERRGTLAAGGTVGMVLQDPDAQVIASRVGDDVAFGCENLGLPRREIWPRVRRALDVVGLDLPLDHPTARLSGGQKQRLALAGVLAMGAQIIVLDEPTANLDPEGQREVVAAVGEVARATGATLVVVEHRHDLWEPLVERILYLADGAVRDCTLSELPQRPVLPPPRQVTPGTPALLLADALLTRWGPPRSCAVPTGHSSVIVGPNGAGKSTLALTLAGLLPPRGGSLVLSEDLARGLPPTPHTWRSAELAQRIGYVFQDPEHQFLSRSVRAELEIGAQVMHGRVRPADAQRIDTLAERLRLTHLLEANPFTLSGGEKRRLSVATALVAAPQLLVLDEPTFGQDPATFTELTSLLRELADSGVTVLSVTHDADFCAGMADHTIEVTAA